MTIARPITKTIISTSAWGIPITDEVNRIAGLTDARTPTPWTNATLLNGWTAQTGLSAPAQYRKIGDNVQVRGVLAGGAVNTVAFVLPTGFRPYQIMYLTTSSISPTWTIAMFEINPNGDFKYHSSNPATTQYIDVRIFFSTIA